MDFIDFWIGHVNLLGKRSDLEHFLQSYYDLSYKKDRLFHVTSDRRDYPHMKITGDIVSLHFYFYNEYGREYRFHFDGTFDKQSEEIHLTSVDPTDFAEMDADEYESVKQHLLKITRVCSDNGGLYVSANGYPMRLRKGEVERGQILVKELFDCIPKDKHSEMLLDSYNWLRRTLSGWN